jgi:hypothetical protein
MREAGPKLRLEARVRSLAALGMTPGCANVMTSQGNAASSFGGCSPAPTLPRFERERLRWEAEGADRAFTLALGELFRPV